MTAPTGNNATAFASSTTYAYRALNRDADEIRLVKVHPGHFDDALQLEIEHAPLITPVPVPDERHSFAKLLHTLPKRWRVFKNIEGRYIFYNSTTELTQWEHPDPDIPKQLYHSDVVFGQTSSSMSQYEALSYVWGTDTATTAVAVVDSSQDDASSSAPRPASKLRVRPNLYEALKYLRYSDKPRTLWIDALCINQHDLAERSVEVKRMGRIFKLASRVVVWLGNAAIDGSSQHALKLLNYLGQQVEYSTTMAFLRTPNAQEPSWYDYDIPLPYTLEDYTAIRRVLERSWWKRLWIWQEILLANRHAIFQCGLDSIPWSFLRHAILNLRAREHQPTGFSFHRPISAPFNLARDHSNEAVLDLIFKTRHAFYTTPQDRIYALFGLMDSRFVETIRPDYTIPIADMFKNFCLAISKYYKHVKFLEYCDMAQATIEDMPSWVPNFSSFPAHHKLDVGFASGSSTSGDDVEVSSTHIEVHGVKCGVVNMVSSPAPLKDDIRTMLQSWEAQFAPSKSSKEAFIVTLLADLIEERWPDRGNRSRATVVELYKRYTSGGEVGHFAKQIIRYAKGRSFFRTESHIGLGPTSARNGKLNQITFKTDLNSLCVGDLLYVLLGCGYPLLLRPCKNVTYEVVGPVYVHDLMNGEALLGPLSSGWTVHYELTESGHEVQEFKEGTTDVVTFEDPRLGPLPPSWDATKDHDKPDTIMFRSRETGKEQRGDPRLTTEQLICRGVDIHRMLLV